MTTLHIYGTGGMGRELLKPAQAALNSIKLRGTPLFDNIGFIDDIVDQAETLDMPVRSIDETQMGDYFIIGVGNGEIRQRLEKKCLDKGLIPYSLFAPTAIIGPDIDIGEGAVFCDFTMATASARIGKQFQCNYYSYVAHDCVIGDYVTFGPRVCCNGNIHIEDFAYIGSGAIIKQGSNEKPLIIGKGATIGMGAVVTKDVPPGTTVIGNPARVYERARM